jgi:4'-phosphopantetheinyl transferase
VDVGTSVCITTDGGRATPVPPVRSTLLIRRIDLGGVRAVDSVAASHLTTAEIRRADHGVPAVRHRRVMLRAGLRQFLGELLGVPPSRVPLLEDDGRPYLPGALGELRISCSAGGRAGLVAVAPGWPVGVDVEMLDADGARSAFAEGWLCPSEERLLRRLPRSRRPEAVTRCWPQKEAVLKGLGVGLRRHPRTVRTPVAASGRIERWWVVPVPVGPDHVASAAVGTSVDDVDLSVEDMTVGDR